ncbi:MAG: DUF1080 domain-containing protein [Chitinophagaceae bacterium]|nr:DUF1080 domain-containing protein [Chitinophagaceae bacterium]
MYAQRFVFLVVIACFIGACGAQPQKKIKIFDGKTFTGWQGDTLNAWRITNGELIGGSLKENVPNNQFIATHKTYTNFILQLKFKLSGNEGFINSGVQFHSQRIKDPEYEMTGYQADLGDGYWGCLYDESRRNKVLAYADTALIKKILKRDSWNTYEVRANAGRIRILLNGTETIDYTETDNSIPQSGLIALQIHGGGKAEAAFKDIFITEIP